MKTKINPEPVRIGMICRANDHPVEVMQQILRAQEAAGLFTIVSMDDEVAWVVGNDKKFSKLMGLPYAPRLLS